MGTDQSAPKSNCAAKSKGYAQFTGPMDQNFRLEPNQFVLAQTLERVCMPNDLIGLVEGRSSYARIGVTVHVTAPKVDPGFQGHITLAMANFGKIPVELRAGVDKPAQLLLAKTTRPLNESELYGTDPADLFQNQTEPIPKSRRGRPGAAA